MKTVRLALIIGVVLALVLSACAPTATTTPAATEPPAAPTQAPATEVPPTDVPATESVATEAPTAAPAGLNCSEPVKVGLITDMTGALAIYGVMIPRSFMLGMEYAAGAAGSAGDVFDFSKTQENDFKIGNCEIQVFVRDDASDPANTTTAANELIDVEKVNILVGTVSSAATATLQGIALQNKNSFDCGPRCCKRHHRREFQRVYLQDQPQ